MVKCFITDKQLDPNSNRCIVLKSNGKSIAFRVNPDSNFVKGLNLKLGLSARYAAVLSKNSKVSILINNNPKEKIVDGEELAHFFASTFGILDQHVQRYIEKYHGVEVEFVS